MGQNIYILVPWRFLSSCWRGKISKKIEKQNAHVVFPVVEKLRYNCTIEI